MILIFSKPSVSMSSTTTLPGLLLSLLLLFTTSPLISALNQDGLLLLSFKHSILNDPLSALSNWNYSDDTPCSWNGVMCMGFPDPTTTVNSTTLINSTTTSRVISLVLPNSRLLGSIAPDVGLIDHLRHLDLSDNLLNGTLPASLFNSSSSELKILSLANNEISGEIPDTFGNATALRLLNLSDNAFTGTMPASLPLAPNISVLTLRNNFLSGTLPAAAGGFAQLQLLDLSSNLFNGSLPADLVGTSTSTSTIQYLNLSSNRFSGEIPSQLGMRMPANAVVDFSFNNLTGGIPDAAAFLSQKPVAFAGNPDLCGKPLRNYCAIPSTLSNPPNVSTTAAAKPPESPPAFAAIPKTTMDRGGGSSEAESGRGGTGRGGGFTPATILAIVIGDLGGVVLLVVAFLYAYHVKKRKQRKGVEVKTAPATAAAAPPACESKAHGGLSCCLRKKDNDGQEGSTETSSSSETEEEEEEEEEEGKGVRSTQGKQRRATLVTFDGDTELEVETLLKAAAYVVGATGTTIVYKAILSDGTVLAVRRIGECGGAVENLKDFKVQVRSIARVRHPNVLRIWGFYWGPDEKLLIHDYAANGSLANISLGKKMGSSPLNLNWDARLKIARGVARGLAYIHEKKSVHGNIKPSNILLDSDMEVKIGDFGLDRLLSGGGRPGTSARLFGSKRSMHSQSSLPEPSPIPGASPLGCSASVAGSSSSVPYQAPELLKNLKPNAKCDVYSFGVILLELVSGRVFSEEELSGWNAGAVVVEERNRILRMADPALRGEVGGREEALLSCFKLGFTCAAAAPQRRPTMKDAVVLLDRLPSSSSSTSSSLLY